MVGDVTVVWIIGTMGVVGNPDGARTGDSTGGPRPGGVAGGAHKGSVAGGAGAGAGASTICTGAVMTGKNPDTGM